MTFSENPHGRGKSDGKQEENRNNPVTKAVSLQGSTRKDLDSGFKVEERWLLGSIIIVHEGHLEVIQPNLLLNSLNNYASTVVGQEILSSFLIKDQKGLISQSP